MAGCKTEIDHAETAIRNGLIYKYGETDPFTGLVLNAPVGLPGMSALCNYQIEKGRHSGKSECFYNSQKVYEIEYLAGSKDGTEAVFDAKTGKKISAKNWKNGRQDGLEEQYRNGNLVSRKEYKDGKQDGEETRWSDDGETVLTELTWRAGKKYDGYETTSEGYKGNYLNGQLHGPQKHGSTEENYENGKLHGVQKKFVSPLHSGVIQQESEVTYDNGVALSGWFKQFKDMDGSVIQEIKLVQSPHRNDEDFRTKYPGDLVPDGLVRFYDRETDSPNGEEIWANGVKIKHSYISLVASDSYDYGDMVFNVLDTAAPYEEYKEVSKDEYDSYGKSPALNSSTITTKTSSVAASDNCLDAWITAFREEVGEDALVVSEQLNEWEDWCSEGRRP
ncbi:MAG: hypothetical protein A3I66_17130 [Burkholderiales bacterium RIFCSPLOWO2_02_FULL_57_36]|nr:MAG: hypothetical protein A3I66_17130 [Burkholderiales bacterium RIFCSPLOWO2_02_FULL_57_36]